MFLAVSSVLYNFDTSLEDAARSLGANRFTTFRRITLPLIKPGVISGSLLAFIMSFDLFAVSLLLKGIGSERCRSSSSITSPGISIRPPRRSPRSASRSRCLRCS